MSDVAVPPLSDLLATARVVALPLVTRFRGIDVREAVLFEGPEGWTEFAPFAEYPDDEAATWLAAAIDFGWLAAPPAVRDRVLVNATVPSVDPDAVPSVLERFPALEQRWDVAAGNLSGGEQQMLAVARSLLREPRVLLIDEMSMGLAPLVVESLMPIVRRVADDLGTVVVLVEQHVRLALEVADRALVMVHGRIRLEGAASALAADVGRLEAAYLGTTDDDADPEPAPRPSVDHEET